MNAHDRLWKLIHADGGEHRDRNDIDPCALAAALNKVNRHYRASPIHMEIGYRWGVGNESWFIAPYYNEITRGIWYALHETPMSPLDADITESDSLWELIANMPIAPARADALKLFAEAEKRGRTMTDNKLSTQEEQPMKRPV